MRVRFAIPDDIGACVAMEPTRFGCANRWYQGEYAKMLQRLLAAGRALSAVVVNENDEPIAFSLSFFISDDLLQRLLEPRNNRLLIGQELLTAFQERQRKGKTLPPILRPDAILQGHRSEGLNLLGFYGWRDDLSELDTGRVRYLLWESFRTLHQGYHLKSFLKEVYGEQERDDYQMMGMQAHSAPKEYAAQWQRHQPYRMSITRSEAILPRLTAMLFRAGRPSVSLSPRMCEAAQLAYLLDLDDAQIAECLPPRRNAREGRVNRREVYVIWSRLHQLLTRAGADCGALRGRHACLRYLRQHPETIFPLRIHTLCYHRPELARRYPLPLREGAVITVSHSGTPQRERNTSHP